MRYMDDGIVETVTIRQIILTQILGNLHLATLFELKYEELFLDFYQFQKADDILQTFDKAKRNEKLYSIVNILLSDHYQFILHVKFHRFLNTQNQVLFAIKILEKVNRFIFGA